MKSHEKTDIESDKASSFTRGGTNDEACLEMIVENAANIISPAWPLQTFIACNPLHGLESLKFEDAVGLAGEFLRGRSNDSTSTKTKGAHTARAVNRELIKWCLAYLDEGQATLKMPGREKGFYQAWLTLAPYDKNLLGKGSESTRLISSLPAIPKEALLFCLEHLAVPKKQREDYLRRALAELPGWAGYIKWRADWKNQASGLNNPITLVDFLAVRLAITCLISENRPRPLSSGESAATKNYDSLNFEEIKAKEEEYLGKLLMDLLPSAKNLKAEKREGQRPDAQLIFCIDVRSEPLRLRVERQGNYETFGFAGFFGLPVRVHSYGNGRTSDSCPVLLKPLHDIHECPSENNCQKIIRHEKGRRLLETISAFYQELKYNFATPFALVESLGLWCGLWMAIRTLAPSQSMKLKEKIKRKLMPPLDTEPRTVMGPDQCGIPFADQVLYAESALRMIGLTENFSRLLVLCGHGSRTENNPYASALDCGACGGNHGGPNAKILAAILNDPKVRAQLKNKGLSIPEDTLCIAAEHNTTTDEVAIYESPLICDTHKQLLNRLKTDLAKAGDENSKSRCWQFGLKGGGVDSKKQVLKRSSDWAEARPEWGLARNAAFIVGPRSLSQETDLHGRCFLHSYDWTKDPNGHLLETILTAPVVVAEWINTQYFFSTIDNIAFGSGSKITHNIAGKIGVMQGNGSDLMHGLPLQSVNSADDRRYHDPLRLQVVVYAPYEAIESMIERQPILKTLFFNGWATLVAIHPRDNRPYRLIQRENGNKSAHFEELNIEPERDGPKLRAGPYSGKSCLVATMHEKQKAISPSFTQILRLQLEIAKIDTDQLGTFTGEVERKGSALDCARRKCELAMNTARTDIGIASEGSFGPHPAAPLIASGLEILYFIDRQRGFHLHQSQLSAKTNYGIEQISDLKKLQEFAEQALFPSHGLIVRPNKPKNEFMIVKGIQTFDRLEEAFIKCSRASVDGQARVETDMRAHMNPTRMEAIKTLADSFALRLATLCPHCDNPGWGIVDCQRGLQCEMCGFGTEMVKCEIYGCPKCDYKEIRSRQDGLTRADPQYCMCCNP